MKLFVTDYWMGWENKVGDWLTLGLCGVVFGVVSELCLALCLTCALRKKPGNFWSWKR